MEMDAENPPIGAGADWTIMQGWDAYSEDDHAMWDRLFERQAAMLEELRLLQKKLVISGF